MAEENDGNARTLKHREQFTSERIDCVRVARAMLVRRNILRDEDEIAVAGEARGGRELTAVARCVPRLIKFGFGDGRADLQPSNQPEIGRASCGERV